MTTTTETTGPGEDAKMARQIANSVEAIGKTAPTVELRGENLHGVVSCLRRLADTADSQATEIERLKAVLDAETMAQTVDEQKLIEIDGFAHEHFTAIGETLPKATNFGEGALCLKEELPRLRGTIDRLAERLATIILAGRKALDVFGREKLKRPFSDEDAERLGAILELTVALDAATKGVDVEAAIAKASSPEETS